MKKAFLLVFMLAGYYSGTGQMLTKRYQLNSVYSICGDDTDKHIGTNTYTFILSYSDDQKLSDSNLSHVTMKTSQADSSDFNVQKMTDDDTDRYGINKNYLLFDKIHSLYLDLKITPAGKLVLTYPNVSETCVDTYFQSKK